MRVLGQGFGTMAQERGLTRVVLCHDLRHYSPRLRDHFAAGLASTGMTVVDIGCGLSPTLYFAQIHLDSPAGVMITASHNPQGWSGLKMSLDFVQTLLRPEIEEMQAICEAGDFASGAGRVEKRAMRDAYIADMLSRVRLERRRL